MIIILVNNFNSTFNQLDINIEEVNLFLKRNTNKEITLLGTSLNGKKSKKRNKIKKLSKRYIKSS